MKKNLWTNLQRILELFTPKMPLSSQKYGVWDPGSRGLKGTGSRIRNTSNKCLTFCVKGCGAEILASITWESSLKLPRHLSKLLTNMLILKSAPPICNPFEFASRRRGPNMRMSVPSYHTIKACLSGQLQDWKKKWVLRSYLMYFRRKLH